MKHRLVIWLTVFSLALSVMPIARITEVYADDGEKQPAKEQLVISLEFEEYLSSLNQTDNITVVVRLKNDAKVDEKIQAIWEGQFYDEYHSISESLKQKYRNLSEAVGPFEEQLRAGEPAAVERFNQLVIEYGLTAEYLKATNERLNEINAAMEAERSSVLEKAYSDMQNGFKSRVEQLPDTTIIDSYFMPNTVVVNTRVNNIKTIAAISEVIDIFQPARGVTALSPYLDPAPLYPTEDSISIPVNYPLFSWTPFKEATKYRFTLARDSAMTQMVKEIEVTTAGYVYDGTLDYSTNYFWRVMALDPAPTEWSEISSFTTEPAPPPTEQDPHQTTNWSPALLVGLVVTIACALGLITWFLVTKSHG